MRECEQCGEQFYPRDIGTRKQFICAECLYENRILDQEWHAEGDFDYSMND